MIQKAVGLAFVRTSKVYITSVASTAPTVVDYVTIAILALNAVVSILESKFYPYPPARSHDKEEKAKLSRKALMTILKPYFWPDATASSATMNRIRALLYYLFVSLNVQR
jgi:hypothetical protein